MPKLVEEMTLMHLVVEITIMAMNLMTLCKVQMGNGSIQSKK